MPTVIVKTTSQDGDVTNNPLTVFAGQTVLTASTPDSTHQTERYSVFFFNTADNVTGIPANAVIQEVLFFFFLNNLSLTDSSTDEIWYSPTGALGTTLDTGDWNTLFFPSYPNVKHVHPDRNPTQLGWWSERIFDPITRLPDYNRSGYTNVALEVVGGPGSTGDSMSMDAFENPSGNTAYLQITYTVQPSIATTYTYGSVSPNASGISFPVHAPKLTQEQQDAIRRGDEQYYPHLLPGGSP